MSKLIRWEIIDTPTTKDPQRRRLMVKAALADLHSLIRSFGAMCGRPKKESGGALFNFSLFLHQPTDENLDALKAELRSMTGDVAEAIRQDPTPSPPTALMRDPQAPPPSASGKGATAEPPSPPLPEAGTQASEENVPVPAPEAVAEAPPPEAETVPAPEPAAAVSSGGLEIPAGEAPGSGSAPIDIPSPGAASEAGTQASEENVSKPAPGTTPEPAPEPVAEVVPPDPPRADPVPSPEPPEVGSTFSPVAAASEEKASGITLTLPSGAAAAPAPQAEAAAPEAVAPAAAEPTPSLPSAGTVPPSTSGKGTPASKENVPAQSQKTREPLCGANLNFNPAKSLDNLKVGSYSRFAHAAATSVLTSPGTMYNPLLVQGPPGSGKSHFLHGLARRFGEAYAQEPVLLSTGIRLAAAVSAASSSGRMGELEAFAGKAKALIIDDLHLMAISEGNSAGLAKLVGLFLGAGKQIVVSSIYPANVLAAVDQSLGLKLGGGHSVELKIPPESACKEIGLEALSAVGIQADEVGGAMFADRIGGNLAEFETAISRLLKLSELRVKGGQPSSLQDLLAVVFGPDADAAQPSPEELKAGVPAQPAQGSGAPAALLFPDGQEVLGDWAWHQLHQAAQQNKWDFPFRQVLRKPYAIDPIGGVPFAIAEDCLNAGAVSALIVGPAAGSELANHESDFRYALDHLVRDIPTAVAWVPQDRIVDPKVYALAYLDLSAAAVGGAS